MKKQLTAEEVKKHIQTIIEDNRTYPPKVKKPKCNKCQSRIPGTAKCKLYPNGIPKEILLEKKDCGMYSTNSEQTL